MNVVSLGIQKARRQYSNETLMFHTAPLISGSVASAVDDCMNCWDLMFGLVPREAGRGFCSALKDLIRWANPTPETLVDENGNEIELDEIWKCCCTPIVTGAINKDTGQPPLFEGAATCVTPDGELFMLQDAIEDSGSAIIGDYLVVWTKETYGKPTHPIVTKTFGNVNPIVGHLHLYKIEVYCWNRWNNPGLALSHHTYMPVALRGHVQKEDLIKALDLLRRGVFNGLRDLMDATLMRIDRGYCMDRRILHSPVGIVDEEHDLLDEHGLFESITLDGRIPLDTSFSAVRPQDFSAEDRARCARGDWTPFFEKVFDFELNTAPDTVENSKRELVRDPALCGDGVTAEWVCYNVPNRGGAQMSKLRLTVQPGAHGQIDFSKSEILEKPVAGVAYANQGEGVINGLPLARFPKIPLGSTMVDVDGRKCFECGYMTDKAVNRSGGVFIGHAGRFVDSPDFVVTLDLAGKATVN